MAASPLITCIGPDPSLEDILNALIVKDNAGNVGLRTVQLTVAHANLSSNATCIGGGDKSAVQILRECITLDLDNKPALVLIKAS
jgi:hypothetical protein